MTQEGRHFDISRRKLHEFFYFNEGLDTVVDEQTVYSRVAAALARLEDSDGTRQETFDVFSDDRGDVRITGVCYADTREVFLDIAAAGHQFGRWYIGVAEDSAPHVYYFDVHMYRRLIVAVHADSCQKARDELVRRVRRYEKTGVASKDTVNLGEAGWQLELLDCPGCRLEADGIRHIQVIHAGECLPRPDPEPAAYAAGTPDAGPAADAGSREPPGETLAVTVNTKKVRRMLDRSPWFAGCMPERVLCTRLDEAVRMLAAQEPPAGRGGSNRRQCVLHDTGFARIECTYYDSNGEVWLSFHALGRTVESEIAGRVSRQAYGPAYFFVIASMDLLAEVHADSYDSACDEMDRRVSAFREHGGPRSRAFSCDAAQVRVNFGIFREDDHEELAAGRIKVDQEIFM